MRRFPCLGDLGDLGVYSIPCQQERVICKLGESGTGSIYSPYIKQKNGKLKQAGLELYFGDPAQLIIVTRSRSD